MFEIGVGVGQECPNYRDRRNIPVPFDQHETRNHCSNVLSQIGIMNCSLTSLCNFAKRGMSHYLETLRTTV